MVKTFYGEFQFKNLQENTEFWSAYIVFLGDRHGRFLKSHYNFLIVCIPVDITHSTPPPSSYKEKIQW